MRTLPFGVARRSARQAALRLPWASQGSSEAGWFAVKSRVAWRSASVIAVGWTSMMPPKGRSTSRMMHNVVVGNAVMTTRWTASAGRRPDAAAEAHRRSRRLRGAGQGGETTGRSGPCPAASPSYRVERRRGTAAHAPGCRYRQSVAVAVWPGNRSSPIKHKMGYVSSKIALSEVLSGIAVEVQGHRPQRPRPRRSRRPRHPLTPTHSAEVPGPAATAPMRAHGASANDTPDQRQMIGRLLLNRLRVADALEAAADAGRTARPATSERDRSRHLGIRRALVQLDFEGVRVHLDTTGECRTSV